ncbi:MAG: hypothetical protein E7D41_00530 [Cutibacterium sp.]|nr:hypothetical protein [Cutibacterium sp.]
MTSEDAAANTAPADSLHGDLAFANVNVNTTAKNNPLDEQEREQDLREREQALAQRGRLFRVVVVMVSVSLVIGTGIIIAYMCVVRGRVDYRVIVAWYGGVAAQTIGVLAVMTRSLFPGKYRRQQRR